MKKWLILSLVLMVLIGWGGYWYFTPRVINHTFSLINKELPTTIVAVNSKSNKISDYTLEQLKKLNRKEQNIVYSTNTMLSKFELNKLKPYVDHVKAKVHTMRDYGMNEWRSFKDVYIWLDNELEYVGKCNLIVVYADTNEVFAPYLYPEQIKEAKTKKDGKIKRYAVFAGYSYQEIIEPYVIDYLKGLDEVSDGIVYIADSKLKEGELEKLKGINLLYVKHEKHGRYDFGSYAIGYNWLKDNGYLEDADEIIFANDSVYAPMTSFKPMFDEMDKRDELDFWGVTQCSVYNNHVQSYFLIYRKQLFNHKIFANILDTIPFSLQRHAVISQYEVMITPYLEALGYKWDSYISKEELEYLPKPIKDASYPLTLIAKHRFQFLKRKVLIYADYLEDNLVDLLKYLKVNNFKLYQYIMFLNPKKVKELKEQGIEF